MFHHYHYHYHGPNEKDPTKIEEWILPYGPEPEWPSEYQLKKENLKKNIFLNISPNNKNLIDLRAKKMILSNPI